MKKYNKTQYVLLGLLNIHPQSGYDLKRNIEKTVGYFWNESYGQIYPTLSLLEKSGLIVKSKIKSSTARQRQVYTITNKGCTTLKTWLQQPIVLPKVRNEMLLKIFFGESNSLQKNIKHIEDYLQQTQQLNNMLKQIEKIVVQHPQYNPKKPYNLLTIRFGLYANEAEMKWCKQTLKALHAI